MKVEPVIDIQDGLHEGVITRIEERITKESYQYIDVVIEHKGMNLKASYSRKLTEQSNFGLLLKRFGAIVQANLEVNERKILIGRKCQFMTMKKPSKKDPMKVYSNIIPESVQPPTGQVMPANSTGQVFADIPMTEKWDNAVNPIAEKPTQ